MLNSIVSIVQKWHYERRRSAHDAEGDDEKVLGWVREIVETAAVEAAVFTVEPVMHEGEVFEGMVSFSGLVE